MITPILKDPKSHGGTLYTFPSASRDLTRAFSNSEYEFAFSHFACLNLPDFRYGNFTNKDLKGIYLEDLHPNSVVEIKDINKSLKWHMQSYVMNYEIAILNGFSLDMGKYDAEILRTPSERIFFNWLQKVNAIKFNSSGEETLDGYGDDLDITPMVLGSVDDLEFVDDKDKDKSFRIGNKLYMWKGGEWKSRILVSKTVQYIGTIDMVNNVNIDFDSFNEIYLNIPAGVGGSTKVQFDQRVFDANYEFNQVIDVDNDDFLVNKEYIIGRDPKELNLSNTLEGKTFNAIYDNASNHSYTIDNGYCINFNDTKYASGKGIEAMNLESEEDFEFNCVLIYYRIRKGNGSWCTNLYGVLFLEEVSESDYNETDDTEISGDSTVNTVNERVGYIQRYPKFKNGNSWGLKLDLKIDAQPDSQMELRSKLYDDPNEGGAGMQMFTEALVHLNDCVRIFYEVKDENTEIEERLYKLENMVSGIDTVYDLRDEVGSLRGRVEMFQPSLNSLQGRLESVENRITQLETKLGYLIKEVKNISGSIVTNRS